MSKIKNENYYVVQGFMVNDLKLKGNELSIFAIIYGFSQEENQWFTGSLQYLADWTGATKQGVLKNLKSLIDKGLIKRQEKYINNVKVVEYKECLTEFNSIKHSLIGYSTEFNGGIKQSLTNNIEDNNIYIKEKIYKREKFVPPTMEELKEYAKSRGREDLARKFVDYYEAGNWKDKDGKQVKNWKQKFITWCGRDNLGLKLADKIGEDKTIIHDRKYSEEEMKGLVCNIDDIEI